jgi:hypothetical protein
MSFKNQFQLVKGARTPGADNLYLTTHVKDKGTPTHAGDAITFTGLTVEIDGNDFTANQVFDFSNLGTLIQPSKSYLVCAVPVYNEPANKAAAEAAGMEYFVQNNARGEAVAYRFFPTDVQTAIEAGGGIAAIADRVLFGGASPSDVTLYNYYYETIQDLNDPRYTAINPFMPIGYGFAVGELVYQDNSAKPNALLSLTKSEYDILRAQLGEVYSLRKVLSLADANARYGSKPWLIKTLFNTPVKAYPSLNEALTDTNGTNITASVETAQNNNTALTLAGGTHVAVHEYTVPANMPLGQTFKGYSVKKWYDRQHSSFLGRINPIYLDNQALTGSVRFPQMAMSRLTRWADPLPLAEVTLDGASAISAISYVFDTGIY